MLKRNTGVLQRHQAEFITKLTLAISDYWNKTQETVFYSQF